MLTVCFLLGVPALGEGQKPQQRSPLWADILAANVGFSILFPNKQAYFNFFTCKQNNNGKHTGFDDCIYLNQPSNLKVTLSYLYHAVRTAVF